MKESEGTDTMKRIAGHVRKGAMAYLKQQYKIVGIVFFILCIFFAWMAYGPGLQNEWVWFAFLTGSGFRKNSASHTGKQSLGRSTHTKSQHGSRNHDCFLRSTGFFNNILAPMLIAAFGVILSLLGIFMVKTREGASQLQLLRALDRGIKK